MKRTTEFVLGLLGGIFGFFGAILALFIGGVDAAISSSGSSEIIGLGWAAIFLSILGIVGAVLVKGRSKAGGIMMLISAIGGLISISLFYLLPFVLLLIAGLMGIFRKDKTKIVNG
ncbi:membrane protein [Bacillus freudenreichii]|nr:membrane protein [Bacillus freudenreichii]